MRFSDPSGTVEVSVPASWALDIAASGVTTLVFTTWNGPDYGHLTVRLTPARVGADHHDAWVAAVRADLLGPGEAVRVDVSRAPGGTAPAVWSVVPGGDGRPDLRAVVVRGTFLDVHLEEQVSRSGGGMRTPLLESALASVQVPADRPAAAAVAESWSSLAEDAGAALRRGETRSGVDLLRRAARAAADSWQRGLREGRPSQRPLLEVATSMLDQAAVIGDLRTLDHASVLVSRIAHEASGTETDRVNALIVRVLRLHAQHSGGPAPDRLVDAAFLRAALVGRQLTEPLDAPFALEAAARCVLLTAGMTQVGIPPSELTGYQELAVEQVGFVAQRAVDVRSRPALPFDPDVTAAILNVAVTRNQRSTQATRRLLVNALCMTAHQRQQTGDEANLLDARSLLVYAQSLLDGLPADVADEVWRDSAFISQALGWPNEVLRLTDRIVGTGAELVRLRAALRSTALITVGRYAEALESAIVADGTNGYARAKVAEALMANGRFTDAEEQVRLDLLQQIPRNPFSAPVQMLLRLLGSALDAGSPDSLAALALAVDLLYYAAHWSAESGRLVESADAAERRRAVARLVLDLHEAGDDLGALAAADRSRALTLAPGFSLGMPGEEQPDRPNALDPKTTVPELLATLRPLVSARLDAVGVGRGASGEQLCEIVTASGRPTLVLHPTDKGIVRILVRPGVPPRVEMRQVSGVDELGRQLAITVVQRGADPTEAQILAALAAWGREPADPDPRDETSRRVHDQLLGGLDLVDGEPLVVVPYRELALLPIATLTDGAGQPIVARHPVSTVPSIVSMSMWPSAHRVRPPVRAVVVGDPAVDPAEGLPDLTGARAEAMQVAALLGVTPLLGPDATEAAVRDEARGARVLHLACHAAVAAESEESALYLTPAGGEDGRLSVTEADDLALDDALVVLAACETGLGRPTPDGVIGLGRAFTRAGARCVLLSLWRVDDAATGALMPSLYRGLLGLDGPPLDIAEALARAQLATRAAHPDVTRWGPWLLVGDGGWRLV